MASDRYCVNCRQVVAPQVRHAGSGCLGCVGLLGLLWTGETIAVILGWSLPSEAPFGMLPGWLALPLAVAIMVIAFGAASRAAESESREATCPICKSGNLVDSAPATPPPAG